MSDDWYTGMDSEFARRLKQLVADSGGRIGVGSGYRSVEEQTQLWNDAIAEYGSEDAARQWVAPPGSSNHNHGVAADLWYSDNDALDWAHANAARYGLEFPMSWEDWHIEPVGVREGTYRSDAPGVPAGGAPGTVDAYTTTPTGQISPTDATQRFSMDYQLVALNNLIMTPDSSLLGNPNANVSVGAEPSQTITRNY